LKNPSETLAIAIYWFAGGYAGLWWTPYALQAGLIGLIIGLLLYLWTRIIEEQGGRIPPLLGGALFAPPLNLMLFGAMVWVISRL